MPPERARRDSTAGTRPCGHGAVGIFVEPSAGSCLVSRVVSDFTVTWLRQWRMPIAARLEVRGKDKSTLRSWVRASGMRAGLAQRARIVLLAAEGRSNTEIATRVGVTRPTVIDWRDRYAEGGLRGAGGPHAVGPAAA